MKQIQLAIGSRGDVCLFRNNVGLAWLGRQMKSQPGTVVLAEPRKIRFGLIVGSADLIGWTVLHCGPVPLAIFTAIEVKTSRGRVSSDQKNFIEQVQASGGIAGIARSVEDAHRIIDGGIAALTKNASAPFETPAPPNPLET